MTDANSTESQNWKDLLSHAMQDTQKFVDTFPCPYCKEDFIPVLEQFRFYLEAGEMLTKPKVDKGQYVEARMKHPASLLVKDTRDVAKQLRDTVAKEHGVEPPSAPIEDRQRLFSTSSGGPLGFGLIPKGIGTAREVLDAAPKIKDLQSVVRGLRGQR